MQDDPRPMVNIAIGWIENIAALYKVPFDNAVRTQSLHKSSRFIADFQRL